MTNVVVLIGRLTKEIELKATQSNHKYARFVLAVNRTFKKEGEQNADFVSCVAWNKQAELLYQYTNKGSQIGIQGRIQTGSYEHEGKRVYTTDIVVENVYFLESKNQKEQTTDVYADISKYSESKHQSSDYDTSDGLLDIDNADLPF